MTTTAALATEETYAAWKRANDRLQTAAACLAYDVTFRAEDPRSGKHSPASPALTARLKAAYIEAHDIERAAYTEWNPAT